MDKKVEIAFGFIVIILVVVGFVAAGFMTIPTKAEIASSTNIQSAEVAIPDSAVIDQLALKIKGYERNGILPVQVNDSEIGKTNPFTP